MCTTKCNQPREYSFYIHHNKQRQLVSAKFLYCQAWEFSWKMQFHLKGQLETENPILLWYLYYMLHFNREKAA